MLFEHGASAFMIPSKESRGNTGGRHDFCIVPLTLVVFLMMHGFQQIITQAERCYNFVVHGLPPLEEEMGVSPLISQNRHHVPRSPLLTEGYEIFPTHLRAEKHALSGTKYRLIWSQFILCEGQR